MDKCNLDLTFLFKISKTTLPIYKNYFGEVQNVQKTYPFKVLWLRAVLFGFRQNRKNIKGAKRFLQLLQTLKSGK